MLALWHNMPAHIMPAYLMQAYCIYLSLCRILNAVPHFYKSKQFGIKCSIIDNQINQHGQLADDNYGHLVGQEGYSCVTLRNGIPIIYNYIITLHKRPPTTSCHVFCTLLFFYN